MFITLLPEFAAKLKRCRFHGSFSELKREKIPFIFLNKTLNVLFSIYKKPNENK